VPGFRKGAKIPESTLVGFLGGKREVKRITVERVLRDSLPYALRSVEKNAIADSESIESNPEELIDAFDPSKPLIFQVGVDMPPKVQFTSPYKYEPPTSVQLRADAWWKDEGKHQ
jgi:FKBP-type peptidyl-prolyl cis-trans isomerase (trigger factor)